MLKQDKLSHSRGYSFSSLNNAEREAQYQNQLPQSLRSERTDAKDIPSFGDGPNCRKAETHYGRFKSANKNTISEIKYKNIKQESALKIANMVRCQSNQNRHSLIKIDRSTNRAFLSESWMQRHEISGDNYNLMGRNYEKSEKQLSKITEQKFENIDKINSKIRKILDTLKDEEKKIAQNHLKIGAKKMTAHFHSYANRIRKQYDSAFVGDCKRKYKQNEFPTNSLYGKLVNIHDKHRVNDVQRQLNGNVLGEINLNNMEKMRKAQQKLYEKQQISSNFFSGNEKIRIKTAEVDTNCLQSTESNVNEIDTPYRLLKGANAKSTDSLSISAITNNLKCEKQGTDFSKQLTEVTEIKELNKPNQSFESVEERRKTETNLRQSWYQLSQFKVNNKECEQSVNANIINDCKYQQPNKQTTTFSVNKHKHNATPAFLGFGQSKYRKTQNTPKIDYKNHSATKLRRSQSCKLRNGRDVDAEILKIQNKINQLQTIKESLGVSEKQCSKDQRNVLSQLNKFKEYDFPYQRKSGILSNHSRCTPYSKFVSKNEQKIGQFCTESHNLQKTRQLKQVCTQNEKNRNNRNNLKKGNFNIDAQVSWPKPFKMSVQKNTRKMGSNIKQTESTFISQERFSTQNTVIQSFVLNICKQIQLDSSFRNSKEWFSCIELPSKWKQLTKKLQQRNIMMTDEQNKQIFTMSVEEDNPFQTSLEGKGSYNQLIDDYINSQQFWIENLHHKYPKSELEKCIKAIDLDGKGNITVKDIVRFINLESDKHYRNRDLCLVFRRLRGSKTQVTAQSVLAEFCQF